MNQINLNQKLRLSAWVWDPIWNNDHEISPLISSIPLDDLISHPCLQCEYGKDLRDYGGYVSWITECPLYDFSDIAIGHLKHGTQRCIPPDYIIQLKNRPKRSPINSV
jgi:hypothetical protein